ncbi:MAG TPA: Glu/Leu/Phe/Val dehydrogenase dimerization domain-containing protein, partial [Kofleriaceae bacterium]|nr:Glu/Leu/Phe/Val dehydrogenase dimerization domain-containing protein [Kofleriaceae bacterium]
MERLIEIDDRATGLRAAIAIDSTALGPAAGGVRTRGYPSFADAQADARALARAMTLKCAVAGLDAGGGKVVVWDHGAWDREAAFERLGEAVEALGGAFRTAGDLGTSAADLAAMARRCRHVHLDETNLAASVARGLLGCAEACLARRRAAWDGLRVAVQGAGAIGSACARAFAARGARLLVA